MYKRLIVTFLILADGLLSAFARQARDVINLNNGNLYHKAHYIHMESRCQ